MKKVPFEKVKKDRIKKSIVISLSSLLFAASSSLFAQNSNDPAISDMQQDLDNITIYLQNMGMYFGYDLTNFCPTNNGTCSGSGGSSPAVGTSSFNNELTNTTSTFATEIDLITSFLGSILLPSTPNPTTGGATASSTVNTQLVPTTLALSPNAAIINTYQNKAITSQNPAYSSPNSGALSVSTLIDQYPYQSDPVNQAILNIISTPDISFCINNSTGAPYSAPCNTGATVGADGSIQNNASLGGGPVLSQVQVMMNTIGQFPPNGPNAGSAYPATGFFALPAQNSSLVPQLNSDSLLGPLIFDNSANSSNNGSTSPPANSNSGLTASSQIEQAANYIRYASGAVTPLTLPNSSVYSSLYGNAVNITGQTSQADQFSAQATIANYLTSLRVYAAQTSVGISNLYSILARRMPQASVSASGQTTSPALSEYLMATWRLQPPTSASAANTTWTAQINTASSATVQKEIAVLLAEINYQLYLARVQQERSLLTDTTMLLQASRNIQPDSRLASPPGAEVPGTSIPNS